MRLRRPDLDFPEALDLAVMKCLKKRMTDRPKNAAALEELLMAIPLAGLPLSYPTTVRRTPAPATGSGPETMGAVDSAPPPAPAPAPKAD
ncbi:MAG: hypothetical protein ABIP39_08605, partial [Polyangiaceae bacterium]